MLLLNHSLMKLILSKNPYVELAYEILKRSVPGIFYEITVMHVL